jgi:hypothetical protein
VFVLRRTPALRRGNRANVDLGRPGGSRSTLSGHVMANVDLAGSNGRGAEPHATSGASLIAALAERLNRR